MFSIEHIKKNYGKNEVLEDITFSVEAGKCVGILGGNGCGKSTLLSVLAAVQKPDGGAFMRGGVDLLKNSKLHSETVGYVPQSTPLIEELSAKDNLSLWYGKEDMKEQLERGVLGMLGIKDFIKVPVHKMSGGMKKRLAIGCAVAHKPEILLLDEPSAALDLICRERISNYLKEYMEQGGAVIMSTHDVSEIEFCDNLYIMKNGVLSPFGYDGNIHRLVGNLV